MVATPHGTHIGIVGENYTTIPVVQLYFRGMNADTHSINVSTRYLRRLDNQEAVDKTIKELDYYIHHREEDLKNNQLRVNMIEGSIQFLKEAFPYDVRQLSRPLYACDEFVGYRVGDRLERTPITRYSLILEEEISPDSYPVRGNVTEIHMRSHRKNYMDHLKKQLGPLKYDLEIALKEIELSKRNQDNLINRDFSDYIF